MKAKRYTMKTWLTFTLGRGAQHEIEAEIEYNFTPGRPATPPSYASGGDPPDPAEVSIESIYLISEDDGGRVHYAADWWVWDKACDSELYAQLIEHGAEQMADDYAEAMEHRREE